MQINFTTRNAARQFNAKRHSNGLIGSVGDNVADNNKVLRYGPVQPSGKAVSKARYYVTLK